MITGIRLAMIFDGKASKGTVKLEAPEFEQTYPYAIPPGWTSASVAFPIFLPVLGESELTMRIYNDERGSKPFRFKWSLEFHSDAKILSEEAGRDFIKTARETAQIAADNLASQSGPKH
jgi:hypothetical protein